MAHLELATVSALSQTAATFIVLLVVELYGVKIGIWRWSAIILGLLGAVIMVRTGSDIFSWSSLFPICAVFCYASATVTMRSFDNSTSKAVVFLYYQSRALLVLKF